MPYKSQIHIYTGNGKGKTTAALGQGLRASGAGYRVTMMCFLKNDKSSEFYALKNFCLDFEILSARKCTRNFYWMLNEDEKQEVNNETREAFKLVKDIVEGIKCDMIIMDEIMAVLNYHIISIEEILGICNLCRKNRIDLIMTGRNLPQRLLDAADLVSSINEVKHPINKGVTARKGIEY